VEGIQVIIAGLDVATHLGFAVWSEGVIVHKSVVHYPPEEGTEQDRGLRMRRYERYAAAVEDLLSEWAVSHVFVEGYGYANSRTLVTLVELGTAVRLVLHESAARWSEVAPSVLKKFVTGNGAAKKDLMLLEVYKRFKVSCSTHDEADAVALAMFGAASLGEPVDLPAAQLALARRAPVKRRPKAKRASPDLTNE
jgi:Holliday junction resolvasome RuvABC endonuclease subunit